MKFECPYKFGLASAVTLVQKRLWYFKEDNKNNQPTNQPSKQQNTQKNQNKPKGSEKGN